MNHARFIVKLTTLIVIAAAIICGVIIYFFKPTYSVSLNGEFIGYTQNKSELQSRINEALQKGNGGTLAFVQIENMPQYSLCMLKRNVQTNDDEIYEKIVGQGVSYYRYFAVLEGEEEKCYISNFDEAESVIETLKEKESTNADKISIVETYSTQEPEYTSADTCVEELYKAKPVVKKVTRGGSGIGVSGMNTSGNVVSIGISLIRPVNSSILTSRYGPRSRDNHKGIDIAADYGTNIYAAASGTAYVAAYGYNGGYGNYIILDHGNGVQTLYGHCSSLCIEQGQYVEQGQLIAKVGSTGISTGNHLHLEVRVNGVAQDPQNYVY